MAVTWAFRVSQGSGFVGHPDWLLLTPAKKELIGGGRTRMVPASSGGIRALQGPHRVMVPAGVFGSCRSRDPRSGTKKTWDKGLCPLGDGL